MSTLAIFPTGIGYRPQIDCKFLARAFLFGHKGEWRECQQISNLNFKLRAYNLLFMRKRGGWLVVKIQLIDEGKNREKLPNKYQNYLHLR